MYHKFWGVFATHMGKHGRNKTTAKFSRRNKASTKKAVSMIRKVAITSNSTKYFSQGCSCNESEILSTTFGTEEITQDEIKELVGQGEFINFEILFQHNYYAYINTKFQA